jgi:hypothetical protein
MTIRSLIITGGMALALVAPAGAGAMVLYASGAAGSVGHSTHDKVQHRNAASHRTGSSPSSVEYVPGFNPAPELAFGAASR